MEINVIAFVARVQTDTGVVTLNERTKQDKLPVLKARTELSLTTFKCFSQKTISW